MTTIIAIIILAVAAVCGVAGYFAAGWWMERMAPIEEDVDAMLPPRGDR